MKPHEIKGGNWAYSESARIVNDFLGWHEDRTVLLRAITKVLEDTYDEAYASGEDGGQANAVFTIFKKLAEVAETNPPLKNQLLDWCEDYVLDNDKVILR